jgi:hypothetical protein
MEIKTANSSFANIITSDIFFRNIHTFHFE